MGHCAKLEKGDNLICSDRNAVLQAHEQCFCLDVAPKGQVLKKSACLFHPIGFKAPIVMRLHAHDVEVVALTS